MTLFGQSEYRPLVNAVAACKVGRSHTLPLGTFAGYKFRQYMLGIAATHGICSAPSMDSMWHAGSGTARRVRNWIANIPVQYWVAVTLLGTPSSTTPGYDDPTSYLPGLR